MLVTIKYWLIWVGFGVTCLLTWPLHHFWLGSLALSNTLSFFLGLINIFLGVWLWRLSRRKFVVGAPILIGLMIGQWWWLEIFLMLMIWSINGFGH
ncbi:MAG TPA: hypothetical protein VGH91_02485 [Gammaproteobacteria bacterium]|jgi:hypothetical protein